MAENHHPHNKIQLYSPSFAAAAGTGNSVWKANCALSLFHNKSLDSGTLYLIW